MVIAQQAAQRLAPCEVVTIKLAAELTGLSVSAINHKIHNGVWVEGRQFHRANDGRIYVDLPEVAKWARRGRA